MVDYSEKQLDRLFFALSDSSRRKMIERLSQKDTHVSKLGEAMAMSKQAISKHIRVLEQAGFVKKTKDGRIQRCELNPQAMQMVAREIERYREFWKDRFDALEAYIESTKKEKK